MTEVRIRLNGGPPGFPDRLRERTVADGDIEDHVKVAFLAGHEHFEYTPEFPEPTPVESETSSACGQETSPRVRQYRWAYRTRIAE